MSTTLRSQALGHPWGFYETTAFGRGGWMRERLTLLPPGTDASERHLVALFRAVPVVGAVGALFAMLLFGCVMPPALAFCCAFGLYGLGIGVLARASKQVRGDCVELAVVTIVVGGDVQSHGNVRNLARARAALEELDRRARSGRLTPAEFELEWACLYWQLESQREAAISA